MQLVILLCIVAGAFASNECPANSHYEECGTFCPTTCKNYENPPKICVLMCNPGCHCDEGYVESGDGQCVLPQDCPAYSSDVCGFPLETGPCNAFFHRYGFSKVTGKCEKFVYGGCRGNENNFKSIEDCEETCHDQKSCDANQKYNDCGTACPLTCDNYDNPPKICPAMCVSGCHCEKGYVKTNDGQCILPENCPNRANAVCEANEEYRECGTACPLTCDNYNNPPKACVLMCVAGCHCQEGYVRNGHGQCVLPKYCPRRATEAEACLAEPETGMCRGYFPMYYYDVQSGTCKQFIYGGCGGNANRYRSVDECSNTCGASQKALDRPDCDKAPESGLCDAYMPRFYYDQEAGMCKKFIYGGCGGNRNNFATEFDCYNKCGALYAERVLADACLQEKVVGPCRAAFRRFYFNKSTGQCEQFIYGGCSGNSNNFGTQEDCEGVCSV